MFVVEMIRLIELVLSGSLVRLAMVNFIWLAMFLCLVCLRLILIILGDRLTLCTCILGCRWVIWDVRFFVL